MSEQPTKQHPPAGALERFAPPGPALQLGLTALLAGLLLAALHALTRADIAANEARRTAALLAQVAPAGDAAPRRASVRLDGREQTLWQLRDGDRVHTIVLAVTAPGGYSGDIELLVGIDRTQRISGVRVTRHRETPGLGDAIDARRGDWIKGFDGLSLQQPERARWAVKKDGGDFDQFTGATITPRAVVTAVRDALDSAAAHRGILFSPLTEEAQP